MPPPPPHYLFVVLPPINPRTPSVRPLRWEQVLSGDRLYLFDPLGNVLVDGGGSGGSGGGEVEGVGRGYRFLDSDLLSRFPHQFEPFVELPFGFSAHSASTGFRSTIIRLPLRTRSSRLSQFSPGLTPPLLCSPTALGLQGVHMTPAPAAPNGGPPGAWLVLVVPPCAEGWVADGSLGLLCFLRAAQLPWLCCCRFADPCACFFFAAVVWNMASCPREGPQLPSLSHASFGCGAMCGGPAVRGDAADGGGVAVAAQVRLAGAGCVCWRHKRRCGRHYVVGGGMREGSRTLPSH